MRISRARIRARGMSLGRIGDPAFYRDPCAPRHPPHLPPGCGRAAPPPDASPPTRPLVPRRRSTRSRAEATAPQRVARTDANRPIRGAAPAKPGVRGGDRASTIFPEIGIFDAFAWIRVRAPAARRAGPAGAGRPTQPPVARRRVGNAGREPVAIAHRGRGSGKTGKAPPASSADGAFPFCRFLTRCRNGIPRHAEKFAFAIGLSRCGDRLPGSGCEQSS